MLKKYRVTSTGIEYWDTEEKRIVVMQEEIEVADQHEQEHVDTSGINLEEMTVKELKEFAESQGIDIPKSMTKKELVIAQITGESID
ncbi:hypothetical protein KZO01_06240 [Kurthia zopfii]|uniref:Rho termination factor, N-terminal domain n=1 Tax=Kurthia zopfii TaxID=1650 RepID=A0A8B4Q926_9BACL|nr:Rho termination factor N-terminal domain-containing protein [Kurthia zopfii]PWI23507.1 hypothetical protein DF281_02900 [Kurthia zopfii]TDR35535.1 Rho termination factor-like protein [Kurthia zopfii]GEK30315.1 hypothetical protein KZO01_06240 [Kurthia zopfii]STX09203.1 Rho termination factor, N-terminal domain [Kurthia zopfii]